MSFYADIAATAHSLLREFGAEGTLTRTTATYNAATGSAAPSSTSETVTAALFPYGDKFVDGTLILSSDRKALISASGAIEPRTGDVLVWGSDTLTVVKSKVLAPARANCIYECQVR